MKKKTYKIDWPKPGKKTIEDKTLRQLQQSLEQVDIDIAKYKLDTPQKGFFRSVFKDVLKSLAKERDKILAEIRLLEDE